MGYARDFWQFSQEREGFHLLLSRIQYWSLPKIHFYNVETEEGGAERLTISKLMVGVPKEG